LVIRTKVVINLTYCFFKKWTRFCIPNKSLKCKSFKFGREKFANERRKTELSSQSGFLNFEVFLINIHLRSWVGTADRPKTLRHFLKNSSCTKYDYKGKLQIANVTDQSEIRLNKPIKNYWMRANQHAYDQEVSWANLASLNQTHFYWCINTWNNWIYYVYMLYRLWNLLEHFSKIFSQNFNISRLLKTTYPIKF
jgi:hypothetical protein